jgi:predicted DNA-binding transcriptional regulator AlpA
MQIIPRRRLLTGKQVALILQRNPAWFYEHRTQLERRGFPRPIFSHLYDAEAVIAWIDAQMDPALKAVFDAKRERVP